MGLAGLYACNVRRLRTEKRKPANFLALAAAYCGLSCVCRLVCCGCFAPVLCLSCLWWLCCWWFFFPSDDCDKKKGQAVGACPIFVGVVSFLSELSNFYRCNFKTF